MAKIAAETPAIIAARARLAAAAVGTVEFALATSFLDNEIHRAAREARAEKAAAKIAAKRAADAKAAVLAADCDDDRIDMRGSVRDAAREPGHREND